jgi:hypothetical protein
MRWSRRSEAPLHLKKAVFADRSPKVDAPAPPWLAKPTIPQIAHKTQQRISLPPPKSAPPPSEAAPPPRVSIPPLRSALPPAPLAPPPPPMPVGPSPEELEALAALRQALTDIGSLREVIFSQTEHQLVELAVTIARQVLARELATDPTVLVGLAREGIKALDERDKIVVRFGASLDDELVHDFTDALRKDAPRCEVVLDPALGPRECVVETELGRVDESVETRLYHVLEALVP